MSASHAEGRWFESSRGHQDFKLVGIMKEDKAKNIIKSILRFFWGFIKILVILYLLAWLCHRFIFQPFMVDGPSMEPNFHDKEYLLIDKLSYNFQEPKRGDVIIFRPPNNPKVHYIKRIIGLPGEKIVIENGEIAIYNSKRPERSVLFEDYLPENEKTSGKVSEILGPNNYFVLGDNRNLSIDSREFGVLSKKNIDGRAFLSVTPKFEKITTPSYSP